MSQDNPDKPNFRKIARQHLAVAQDVLASESNENLRYAALELRLAIEALTYELLTLYLDEVGDQAMRKWQPRAVIAELAEVDPYAEISWTLSVGEGDEEKVVATEHRINSAWAHKSHNALGNFLHIPTFEQMSSGAAHNISSMKRKCIEVAEEIDKILQSPISAIRMNVPASFSCVECGYQVRRQITAMQPGKYIRCRNCDAIYDIGPGARAKLRSVTWTCSKEHENRSAAHKLVAGVPFSCQTCGEPQKAFRLTAIKPDRDAARYVDVNPLPGETKNLGLFFPPTESSDQPTAEDKNAGTEPSKSS